ncbi:unnamed protein product [Rotaria socialis]|uniref:Carrier domain-containing protein n=1 Tax=Rotaria socialis TaxID=392032 RepID=A0A821LA03_9BILA|nr:unnamed protein product [Rotaria socialis]CAF4747763.1 unnamed protein product [Rotaria socialis]
MPLNVIMNLIETAEASPQLLALELDEQGWTYSELLMQINRVASYLRKIGLAEGQVVCQYAERSLEMISGLLGIMVAGGVYCSLNPTDPTDRIQLFLDEVQAKFILLHYVTRKRFPSIDIHVVDLDEILLLINNNADVYVEGDVFTKAKSGSYVICTSGTTGHPKAILHTHESLAASIEAKLFWQFKLYKRYDKVLQVAACSWAMHLLEVFPPLVSGGTLVLLQPGGNLNMAYFCKTIKDKKVSVFTIGSSAARVLADYLTMGPFSTDILKSVRNFCMAGESSKITTLRTLINYLDLKTTRVFIFYGLSECNTAVGHVLSEPSLQLGNISGSVPIGRPLPGYRCVLVNEQGELIDTLLNGKENQGSIHIGGRAIFRGYLNNDQLTRKTLVTLKDNKQYVNTGDLAWFNEQGDLVLAGRLDFQMKIRGQRVEGIEIENTIIEWSPQEVNNCLVVKHSNEDDESLVAYIVSAQTNLDIDSLRSYCQSKLRSFMVPSHFIVLKQLPVNSNGKVDRKQLPRPEVSENQNVDEELPKSKLEKDVYELWRSMLRTDNISRYANCYSLGGSSLSLMKLFNHYQFLLAPAVQLNILDFFAKPTIAEHVKLLSESLNKNATETITLQPLCQTEGE